MSNTVVKPQRVSIVLSAAFSSGAGRVPASRSGSARKCTWLFQNPAVTNLPLPSITVTPAGTVTVADGPTAAMRPSRMSTVP